MTVYLCNVGTSSAQAVLKDRRFLDRYLPAEESPVRIDSRVVQSLGGLEQAVKALLPFFLEFDYRKDEDLRWKLSAEVHSLVRCGLSSADRVVLFYSETDDGEVSARLVEYYLRGRIGLPHDAVTCRKVAGLQVNDPVRFRREGVPNYFRLVLQEGDRCGWTDLVLNPTGGYKALVSYATLLGMFFGVSVRYIFDNGAAILNLPPLPVEIDRVHLLPLLPTMERIESESAMPQTDFWGATSYELRERYDSLLEDIGNGQVTLSPIGFLVLERLRLVEPSHPLAVYFSPKAWKDFLTAPKDWDVKDFCERLQTARDLDRYRHQLSDGTLWLKPGNTSDRYRVELESDRLLVYRILSHEEYERAVGRSWPRAQYSPFSRFDVVF